MAKKQTFISYEVLPEGKDWSVGHTYRMKLVAKQVGNDENGTYFEIVDATSLEPTARQRYLTSDEGTYAARS